MSLFGKKNLNNFQEVDSKKKNKKKIIFIILGIIVFLGAIAFWKAESILNKVSTEGGIFSSIAKSLPGVESNLKGQKEDRINILLLGMRGENVPGGGTLADTIMVASIKPSTNKISFLSIPRDLYVDNPNLGNKSKINAVYAYGEQDGKNVGISSMKEVVGKIVGQEIHYAIVINFKGFTDLVDAVGGIEVSLDKPFEEAMQFNEEKVCDSYTFTKPTGKFEYKYHTRKDGSKYVAAAYKLCTNPNVECGGDFKLPAGVQTLSGEKALCYARSRKTSSDFERARRQQMIIQKIKEKAVSIGTLSDFEKVSAMANVLGDNLKTDLELWEMKKLYELEKSMQNPEIIQKVLENSGEGLLYNPPETKETGYILLPIGDNYNAISQMFSDVFPAVNAPSENK
jgi:LCP family protein required for cell wall assembly